MRPKRSRFPRSFFVRAAYSFVLIAAVVLIGTVAMSMIEGWSYLDSFFFTSFIATGQGPPADLNPQTGLGKVVSSVLAFISVGTVVTALLFLFGPFLGEVFRVGVEKIEEVEREIEGKSNPEAKRN